jgi:hypothetical protein
MGVLTGLIWLRIWTSYLICVISKEGWVNACGLGGGRYLYIYTLHVEDRAEPIVPLLAFRMALTSRLQSKH